MELILDGEAGRAQDISDILSQIRNFDKDNVQDLTLSITGLNNLSWALRELAAQIDAVQGKVSRSFADDLGLLQNSVAFTLQDVWTILGKIPKSRTGGDYRRAWKEVVRYCAEMGKQSLHLRLETYQLFIYGLCKALKKQTYSRRHIDNLRHEINDLQSLQRDNRALISATDAFANLALVPAQSGMEPQTQRPLSPTTSHDSYDSLKHQAVPSPPTGSPTTTFSTISHASSIEPESTHWAFSIYNNLPSTSLEESTEISRCFGEGSRSGRSWPDADFDPILKLKFPGGLRTTFFWRARDYRAKIACEWTEGKRGQRWSCMALSDLHMRRSGPFLYLCRPTPEAANTVWASLKFTAIEWLIVYHCTFLSLRSHDSSRHIRNSLDHDLAEEKSYFSGAIRDSGYKHALRVYRDRGTDALRLEASVLKGEMENTPIWTAFITHCITSPTWCRYSENSSTVYLADLRRHVFSSDYTPHVAANGEHFLDFELVQDAEDFVNTVEDFGEEYRKAAK
ncbi:uncharacterized protein A1O9_02442 [Exophiala aquamarina CBS 119918]|uniref:Uncharacterized protein n=1 Tax=Exophiala aquamarina CBS 119918 TaxID=1182545 RepID=A0A072PZ35_9EURO|nr:uncharacterized protein A1O9_02442 [Exophiala aquamarina CBS 119918]KEF60880.1 hypothetical protein A1O9_02442 [Exophiala aquamarina CBS 119918]